ncbi:Hint domain-containing protein [Gimesia maris]|uniref:Hint domain-containing protein n=1 Tax=Gimesia maris TaxID=122 RepID=UPI0012B9B03B|nr:Hint domain-containing protein [Gimesia maris]
MSRLFWKIISFSLLLFTGFCFLKAGAGLVSDNSDLSLTEVEAAVPARITQQRLQTTPIQQMRPGMRVLGRNPDRWDTQSVVEPDLESWRLVSVRMEQQQPGQFVLGQLLRPLSWIRQNDALPGAVIMLNMPEMYVVGAAEVLSISDCPPIDPGDGPVVLSTFKNIADNILNIYVEGEAEPIGVTAGHPIWSEDRQAFIHSDQLQPGERLRSAVGRTVRITSIEIRAGPETVYGLEVAGEHVYSVTGSGLLVHNTTLCDLNAPTRHVTNGPAGAMYNSAKPLTGSQRSVLGNLQSAGTEVVVGRKFVSMNDLRNLTLHTGDEFAMLTRRGERMIIRGDGGAIPALNVDRAAELSAQGWRFSGHTHTPGFQAVGSLGDKNVLRAFGQRQSAVWGTEWGSQPGRFFGQFSDEIDFNMGLFE